MQLQELCEQTVADVDGCLGCSVVDLETGLPLGIKVAPRSIVGQEAMELMSAAGADYFRGRMVWQLELAMTGGQSASSFVQEIQTTTEHTSIFMSVVPGRDDTLLLLITDKAANLGLGRIAMRQALARIVGDGESGARPAGEAQARPLGQRSAAQAGSNVIMPGAFGRGERPPADAGRSVSYRDDFDQAREDEARLGEAADRAARQWRGGHGRR